MTRFYRPCHKCDGEGRNAIGECPVCRGACEKLIDRAAPRFDPLRLGHASAMWRARRCASLLGRPLANLVSAEQRIAR